MDIINNEHSYLNIFFRGFPLYISIMLFVLYLYSKNNYIFYLLIGIQISAILTFILKNMIFYPIQLLISNFTNQIDYPFIGRFTRPDGAKNSGLIYISEDNYSYSQGMPSGHSLSAAFISTYFYLVMNEKYNINQDNKNIFIFSLVFTLYTMYSRVYVFNVHTFQQTVIGAYIGYIFAIYYYNFIKKLNQRMK